MKTTGICLDCGFEWCSEETDSCPQCGSGNCDMTEEKADEEAEETEQEKEGDG